MAQGLAYQLACYLYPLLRFLDGIVNLAKKRKSFLGRGREKERKEAEDGRGSCGVRQQFSLGTPGSRRGNDAAEERGNLLH